jgi:hypothetical protein
LHAHEQLVTPHPGIVDQNIYSPERLDDLFKGHSRGCIVGDVELENPSGTSHLLEGNDYLLSRLTLAGTRHSDARARPSERQRNRPTNTT